MSNFIDPTILVGEIFKGRSLPITQNYINTINEGVGSQIDAESFTAVVKAALLSVASLEARLQDVREQLRGIENLPS